MQTTQLTKSQEVFGTTTASLISSDLKSGDKYKKWHKKEKGSLISHIAESFYLTEDIFYLGIPWVGNYSSFTVSNEYMRQEDIHRKISA